jgi:Zn-dependent protease
VFGGGSIQLARVFGIRIGVDPSWFIVLFLIIWSLSGAYQDVLPGNDTRGFLLATASALLFFLSVVLHELGHAVVAMRNGIGILGIDLWLFGGLARMTRDTDSAGVEFRVAVAGPLVTLAIAVACFGGGVLLAGSDGFASAMAFERDAGVRPVEAVLAYLSSINAVLLLFNLIPGFPLDGGRIARAIAWWRTGDRARATRFAARLGRGFAYAIAGLGVFLFLQGSLIGGVWFVFIGMFLAQAARAAEAQSTIASRIEGLRVADVMDPEPVAVSAETKLDRALDEYFLRYGWPWFPVIDRTGKLRGVVSRERVDEVPESLRPGWTIDEVTLPGSGSEFRVRLDEPLEAVLGSEPLRRLGALMAVDGDGVLRGVVTVQQIRRALQTSAVEPAA